ncbi:RnfABCDGE type electron transport complex subunit D [Deferrisoma palaeochoriense]
MPQAKPQTPPRLIRWQPNMAAVLTALVPAFVAAVYFYGWRAAAVVAVTNAFAFATEYAFTRRRGEPVTLAVFVTGTLLALSLPPSIPFWMCAVGAVVAVGFGKELFGGMGRNVYNPALVGRAFLYVSFPVALTGAWTEPFWDGLGGLGAWAPGADAATSATLLPVLAHGAPISPWALLWGSLPGSLGETCKPALLLGGAYILWKRVASWEIVASCLGSFALLVGALRLAGFAGPDPLRALLAGGFLYGALFMATDPVSANRTRAGRVLYGCVIGVATVLIREFGNFPEGAMFAILLGNTFGPILEEGLAAWKARRAGEAAP